MVSVHILTHFVSNIYFVHVADVAFFLLVNLAVSVEENTMAAFKKPFLLLWNWNGITLVYVTGFAFGMQGLWVLHVHSDSTTEF